MPAKSTRNRSAQRAPSPPPAPSPRVRPVRLEGCGHFIMLDRPAALAQLIDRFAQNPDGEPVAAR